jgi:hypothetical protein
VEVQAHACTVTDQPEDEIANRSVVDVSYEGKDGMADRHLSDSGFDVVLSQISPLHALVRRQERVDLNLEQGAVRSYEGYGGLTLIGLRSYLANVSESCVASQEKPTAQAASLR